MTKTWTMLTLSLVLLIPASASAASWRVGIAKIDITPTSPTWMGGYASRTHPADGTLHPLWAKALVIEDAEGHKAVILTVDAIGMTRAIVDAAAERIRAETGVPRENLLINSSHTHSGPVVNRVTITYDHLSDEHKAAVVEYASFLQDRLVAVAQKASRSMQPANLAFGEGKATFAINRRLSRDGKFVISPNPTGPVDHVVPVMRITDQKDRLLAVWFGYASHNTTLSGYQYCGDYAGFAQVALEKAHPEATALFMIGCGGDANPNPRGTVALAEQHGQSLAAAVETVLKEKLTPVAGPLHVAFARVDLPLVDPPTKGQLLQRRGQGTIYQQRLTEHLLTQLDTKGSLPTSLSCPLQVIQFGDDLTLIGLSGESVSDYARRLRAEFPKKRLWIAGYCNDVFSYLPSERVLAEGGYEGGDSMMYFGIHGPFKPGVEDRVVDTVKRLVAQCEW